MIIMPFKDFWRDLFTFQVYLGQIAPESLHGRFSAERLDICAGIAVQLRRQFLQVDVVGKRHAAGVDLKYLKPAFGIGDANLYLPVKPAGTPERGVEAFGPVGGARAR